MYIFICEGKNDVPMVEHVIQPLTNGKPIAKLESLSDMKSKLKNERKSRYYHWYILSDQGKPNILDYYEKIVQDIFYLKEKTLIILIRDEDSTTYKEILVNYFDKIYRDFRTNTIGQNITLNNENPQFIILSKEINTREIKQVFTIATIPNSLEREIFMGLNTRRPSNDEEVHQFITREAERLNIDTDRFISDQINALNFNWISDLKTTIEDKINTFESF